jgi:hypothetical protein
MNGPTWMAAVLLMAGVTGAGCGGPAEAWDGLAREGAASGVPVGKLNPLMERCRQEGWDPEQAGPAFAPAFQACREGMPADPILERIEEGLGKGVDPEQVAAAAADRYASVARAHHILRDAWGGEPHGNSPVLRALTRNLEAGLDEAGLQALLADAPSRRLGPLAAVLDGGELLVLSGFPADETLTILRECLDRNLGRQEVVRLVALARRRFQNGEEPATIRQDLWTTDAPRGRRGGPPRGQGGGPGRGGNGGRGPLGPP